MEQKKIDFLKNLEEAGGIISSACKRSGISRTAFYKWKDADEEFARQVADVTEVQVDFVESKLLDLIRNGDTTATIFYLKTKGKHHGYSDKNMPQKPQATVTEVVESSRELQKRIKKQRKNIVKMLTAQGKYTEELSVQVDVVAELVVRKETLYAEINSPDYNAIDVEISREGNERKSINPKETLYLNVTKQLQRALQALGMNVDAKERKTDNDSLGEFLSQFAGDDE